MKISKLFHWLYAILMLLPVVVFIPTAFYYGFNEHAVAQEKTEQVPSEYYETNSLNGDANNLQYGHVYFYKNNANTDYRGQNNLNLFFIDVNFFKTQFPQYADRNINSILFLINPQGVPQIFLYGITTISVNSQPFYFVYQSGDTSLVNQYLISYIEESDKTFVKTYQPLTTNMSITDSISYAWHSVWQNDLFSWTYDSFLTEPFLYITNLFNVPANNTLVYCLSYWLNLSIIWLTFDVIMYVPLLVHRWLDKGIVE